MNIDPKEIEEHYGKLFAGFQIYSERIFNVLENGLSPVERPEDPKVLRRLQLLLSAHNHSLTLIVLGGHYKECEVDNLTHDKGLVDRCILRAIVNFKPRKRPLV